MTGAEQHATVESTDSPKTDRSQALEAMMVKQRQSRRWQTLRVVIRNRASLAGVFILVAIAVGAAGAHWISPYPPSEVHIPDKVQAPSSDYLLGTDQFGRDILSRLLYGARISVTLSVLGVTIALIIGTVIGAAAGFNRRWVDEVLMRTMDVIMAFPYIVLAIAMVAALGPSLRNIVLIVAFTRIPQFARVARGSVLALKHAEYVTAARTAGLSEYKILLKHILPNIVTPIVVLASLSMATAILTESSLSFLGLGVQPPTASWGTMIGDGRNYVRDGWWISTVPGVAISLAILAFNLIGDGLRDALDPRLR